MLFHHAPEPEALLAGALAEQHQRALPENRGQLHAARHRAPLLVALCLRRRKCHPPHRLSYPPLRRPYQQAHVLHCLKVTNHDLYLKFEKAWWEQKLKVSLSADQAMSRVPHRRSTACALLTAATAALFLRLPVAGAALINRPGAYPVLTSNPSWSGTPLRPRLMTERNSVIKNPRQGRGQQVPKGGGLLDEVARWDAEGGSGEDDLDLLAAMSKHRHGDEASARPADDGSQCEDKDAPSIPRPGLRDILRAEARLNRPLRAPPDRALDGLEGLTADELRSLADMTQGGRGSELAAGSQATEQADAAGSEVSSSAHAGDGPAAPPAKTPPEMMRIEMLRRENSFLRMQLKQLGQQAHGRQDHDDRSSEADESQDESRGAADPHMGSDHAMKMMDEQLRRLSGSHPGAWPQRHERAHKRRRSTSHPGWLPPTPSPTAAAPGGAVHSYGMRACTGGLGGLLQRRRRDGRLAVIPGVGACTDASMQPSCSFFLSRVCPLLPSGVSLEYAPSFHVNMSLHGRVPGLQPCTFLQGSLRLAPKLT